MSTIKLNSDGSTIPSINDPRGMGSAFNDWASGHRWVGVCTENNLQVLARPYPINMPDNDSSSATSDAAPPSSTDTMSDAGYITTDIERFSLATDQVYLPPIHVKSAFGYWEVHATYDKPHGALNPFSVFLTVPGYGRTCIARDQSVILYTSEELLKDPSKRVQFKVNITSDTGASSKIHGVFVFFYGVKDHQTEVVFSYKLKTPYTGKMEDKISLFPASVTSRYDPEQVDPDGIFVRAMKSKNELLRVTATQGKAQSDGSGDVSSVVTLTYDDEDKNDHDLLLHYLDNRVYDLGDDSVGHVIALHSEYDDTTSTGTTNIATSDSDSSKPKSFSLSLHFLGICELVGSISPSTLTISANLFIVVPVAGRVELTSIKGSLSDGVGVTATVDVFAAKGTAKVFAKKNDSTGKHDLYCKLSLQVVLVGEVTVAGQDGGGLKIFALPF